MQVIQSISVDGINYELTLEGATKYATVVGCSQELTEVNIPAKIYYEGIEYPVTSLHGFYHASFKKITIPDAVEEIPITCFSDCFALEEVVFS